MTFKILRNGFYAVGTNSFATNTFVFRNKIWVYPKKDTNSPSFLPDDPNLNMINTCLRTRLMTDIVYEVICEIRIKNYVITRSNSIFNFFFQSLETDFRENYRKQNIYYIITHVVHGTSISNQNMKWSMWRENNTFWCGL